MADPAAVPRHGPRQQLTVDQVVAAATALADAEGLEAVTMRRVARHLGVVPMTLYTYVPGKAVVFNPAATLLHRNSAQKTQILQRGR